jgi:Fe-S cluster biogenesis protein NfuA
MELHGAAMEKIIQQLAASGESGLAIINSLSCDELVSSLLLLYGLHPHDLETRVRRGLEKARPLLKSHGGDVYLHSVRNGIVHLRLEGSCHGCPSSTLTLKSAVETAIFETAPDVVAIEVEGETELAAGPQLTFVPLGSLGSINGRDASEASILQSESSERIVEDGPSIPVVRGETS